MHLTVAFIGEVSPKKNDKIKAIMDTVTFDPFGETVKSIALMKSERICGELTYTAIYERRALDKKELQQ